jgi:hypothetical protein
MKRNIIFISLICVISLVGTALTSSIAEAAPFEQGGDSDPPEKSVKLIFIHHSTGENWLMDGYGGLGLALQENNYYVSDTNYGWGPEGIGDRTDIPDWEEWFSSENTPTYLEALFREGDQHADYTRSGADPGGENEIILFKSCFPNSDLDGSPDDPPAEDGWLSVGHAKYVYNEILQYFGQHPEKLFVVITAPPLSDRSNAANARAFNLWLMNDWLAEDDYPYQNVAVFDFYNVLTGKDGHHTFENGEEVHQIASKDTLHYPSGDDHPSKKGSQKATSEFIPLLNYFYQRWQAGNPAPLEAANQDDSQAASQTDETPAPSAPVELSGLIDDFEGAAPAGSNGWEAFWDEGTTSSLSCGVNAGPGSNGNSLGLDYQIVPYSWGTCGLNYDQPQDWSDSRGLAFSLQAAQSGRYLHVDLFAEGPQGRESYVYLLNLEDRMVSEWVSVSIPWDSFQRVEWESDPGEPFKKPDQISGLAFGFSTEEEQQAGEVWIDDLGWMTPEEPLSADGPGQVEEDPGSGPETESGGINLPCIGSLAMPVGLAGVALLQRRKGKKI